MNDDIQLIPSKFKNTYNHWMSNARLGVFRDSFGEYRIPAWYNENGDYVIARTEERKPKNNSKSKAAANDQTRNLRKRLT